MTTYLLDTNHVSALWEGRPSLVERLEATSDAEFVISMPTVGELWFMVFNSARPVANRSRLRSLLRALRVWQFDHAAATQFGRIKAALRRSGTLIPDVDVQIAAVAKVNGVVLLTADAHFSFVPGLLIENWLAMKD